MLTNKLKNKMLIASNGRREVKKKQKVKKTDERKLCF